MTLHDESDSLRPSPEGPMPVLEIPPGTARTGPWIVSRGQWAFLTCEVLPPDGPVPVEFVIEVETKDRDEPDAAAAALLPLSLDGGPWRVTGQGVHRAEFVRLRDLVRLRWRSRRGTVRLRMLPTGWHELPDGFVWITPWIPRGPSNPARIQVRFEPASDGEDPGSGMTVHASVVIDPEGR